MTLTRIADPESIERQGKLLAAMERYAAQWLELADAERAYGFGQRALDARRIAWSCQQFAGRARRNLAAVAAIEQSAQIAESEPPDSCPLADCNSRSAVVIDQHEKGYRIHLFHRTPARPASVGWWARLTRWWLS